MKDTKGGKPRNVGTSKGTDESIKDKKLEKGKDKFFNVLPSNRKKLNKILENMDEFIRDPECTGIYKPIKDEKNGEYSFVKKALEEGDICKNSYYEQFKFLQKLYEKKADEKIIEEIKRIQSKIKKLCTHKNGDLAIDNLKYKKMYDEIKEFLEEIDCKKTFEETISKIGWHNVDEVYKCLDNVSFTLKDNKIKKEILYKIFKKLDESVVEQYWKNEKEVYDMNHDELVLLRDDLDRCVFCGIFDATLRNHLYKKFKWLDPDSYELKENGDSLYRLAQNIRTNQYVVKSLKCLVLNIEREKFEDFNNFAKSSTDYVEVMRYVYDNMGGIPDWLLSIIDYRIGIACNTRKRSLKSFISEIKWYNLESKLSFYIGQIFRFPNDTVRKSIEQIFDKLYETAVTKEQFDQNPDIIKGICSDYGKYKNIARKLIKDFYNVYKKMSPIDIDDLIRDFETKLKQKVKYDEIVKDGSANKDKEKVQDAEVLKDKSKDVKEKAVGTKNAIPKANGTVGLKLLISLAKHYLSSKEKISLESISSVLPDYIFVNGEEASEDNKTKDKNKDKGYNEEDCIALVSELKKWYDTSDESDEKYFLAERIDDFIKHCCIRSTFKFSDVAKDQDKDNKIIQSLLPLCKGLRRELSDIKSKVSKKMQEIAFGVAKINSSSDYNRRKTKMKEFEKKIENAMKSNKKGIYDYDAKEFNKILDGSAGLEEVLDNPKELENILKDFTVYYKDVESKKWKLYEYIAFSKEDLFECCFEELLNKLKKLEFGNYKAKKLQSKLLGVLKTELPSLSSNKSPKNSVRNLITDLNKFVDCVEKSMPKIRESNKPSQGKYIKTNKSGEKETSYFSIKKVTTEEYVERFKNKLDGEFENLIKNGCLTPNFDDFSEIQKGGKQAEFVSKYLVPIGEEFFDFCGHILNLRKIIMSDSNKNETLVISDLDFDYLPNRELKIKDLGVKDSENVPHDTDSELEDVPHDTNENCPYDPNFKKDFEELRNAIDSLIKSASEVDMETLKIPEKIRGILKYTFMYDKFKNFYLSSSPQPEELFSICRWGYEHLDIKSMKKDNSDKCKCTKLVLDLLSVFYHHLHKSKYGEKYTDNRWKANECLIWRTEGPGRPYLSSNDVHQGGMGDCFLEATLLSLLTEKDKLLDVFPNRNKEVSSDGHLIGSHITVRLYKISYDSMNVEAIPSGSYVDIVLDATQLWNKNRGSIFNKLDIMWPHFIEKAMSTFYTKSHYVNFGSENVKTQEASSLSIDGGRMYLCKSILTGCASKRHKLKYNDLNSTLSELTKAISSSKAITCGTRRDFGVNIGIAEQEQTMTNGEKIYSEHAYRLVGVIPSEKKIEDTIVVVLNPWNNKKSNKINVPLGDFIKYFNEISY